MSSGSRFNTSRLSSSGFIPVSGLYRLCTFPIGETKPPRGSVSISMILPLLAIVLSGPGGQLPEVEASVNSDGGAMRCEPAIAIRGKNVLVGWNDSYGGAHGANT